MERQVLRDPKRGQLAPAGGPSLAIDVLLRVVCAVEFALPAAASSAPFAARAGFGLSLPLAPDRLIPRFPRAT
jgi:hypothetical protein